MAVGGNYKEVFNMKVLCKKNDYLLVKFESEDKFPNLYSYGSAEYINKHINSDSEEMFNGTKEEVLKSCRVALKQCKANLQKYSYRDMPAIMELLEQQKTALTAFISILKGSK